MAVRTAEAIFNEVMPAVATPGVAEIAAQEVEAMAVRIRVEVHNAATPARRARIRVR